MKLQTVVSGHKVLGMIATFFILLLSLTGILLMHTDDLNLAGQNIKNASLLALYNIKPESEPVTFSVDAKFITQVDNQIYLNDRVLLVDQDRLVGAVSVDDVYLAGFNASLLLFTPEGEIIEQLNQVHGIPDKISAIGSDNGLIVIDTGEDVLSTTLDFVSWSEQDPSNVMWSERSQLPDELMDAVLNLYLGDGLPLERIILDLHSGRILGSAGVLIMDIAVIVFLVLSISGWLAWYKRRELQKIIDSEEDEIQ